METTTNEYYNQLIFPLQLKDGIDVGYQNLTWRSLWTTPVEKFRNLFPYSIKYLLPSNYYSEKYRYTGKPPPRQTPPPKFTILSTLLWCDRLLPTLSQNKAIKPRPHCSIQHYPTFLFDDSHELYPRRCNLRSSIDNRQGPGNTQTPHKSEKTRKDRDLKCRLLFFHMNLFRHMWCDYDYEYYYHWAQPTMSCVKHLLIIVW